MTLETLVIWSRLGSLFPLHSGRKTPIPKWKWRTKNSVDLQTLNMWLDQCPTANWALIPTQCVVVDIDMKNGRSGLDSIAEYGELPPTLMVRTPSGGLHAYYSGSGVTANNLMPGVDLRGSDKGYIVLPWSRTSEGAYELVESGTDYYYSDLPPVPDWLSLLIGKRVLQQAGIRPLGFAKPENESVVEPFAEQIPIIPFCTLDKMSRAEWKGVRKEIRYRFFQGKKKFDNRALWHRQAARGDTSQSGYEYHLAVALACVGATVEEIRLVHQYWLMKHHLPSGRRFEKILRIALQKAQPYIDAYRATLPKRRKHGTTKAQIIETVADGAATPKAISQASGLSIDVVRKACQRMCRDGILTRDSGRYSVLRTPLVSVAA